MPFPNVIGMFDMTTPITHTVVYDEHAAAFNDVQLQYEAERFIVGGGEFRSGQFNFFTLIRLAVIEKRISFEGVRFLGFADDNIVINRFGNFKDSDHEDAFFCKDYHFGIVEQILMKQSRLARIIRHGGE